jgi:hypothetical protein
MARNASARLGGRQRTIAGHALMHCLAVDRIVIE